MYVYHWFTSYCIYSTVHSVYVDFQKKIKIHAALQVLYWQYCFQPREFLIFLITNNPPTTTTTTKKRNLDTIYSTVHSFYVDFQKQLKIHAALQDS